MAKLIYTANTSLDGYIEDRDGNINFAEPDDEVHAFHNDRERSVGTSLYGRRMYETMLFWETVSTGDDVSAITRDFARIWRSEEKVVFSRTLQTPSSERTRIERKFEPTQIRQLKASLDGDISMGGAELAGQALAAGLVDECHLFVSPILLGGGKSAFPDDVQMPLKLLDQHRFGNGVVHLHYAVGT